MRPLAAQMSSTFVPWLFRVPWVSDRLAAHLFLTPLGAPRPEELLPPEAKGERLCVQGQRKLEVVRYGEGPPVFLVHGWGGRGAQMNGFVDTLVRRGYSAITLDLPAHGAARGRTNVRESSESLLALQRKFGASRGVIAHSYGAAATAYAVRHGLSADALVFLAPLPSLEVGMSQFASRASVPYPVIERAARRVEKDLGVHRSMTDLKESGCVLRRPLLLIHDVEDRTVAYHHSRDIAQAWPWARLWTTEGLGHRRILRDAQVVKRAVAFLEQGTAQRRSELELRLSLEC